MNPLRVGIISGVLHPKCGGTPAVVRSHMECLAPHAIVKVFGVAGPEEIVEVKEAFPGAGVSQRSFPYPWFRGKGLSEALVSAARDMDVLHAHLLWDHAVYAAWRAARLAKKPLVLTLHGPLAEPWRYSAIHKRAYRRIFADRILRDATCVHALNAAEKRACIEYGITSPIRVIPNGLHPSEFERLRSAEPALCRWPQLRGRRTLLYLGRLWKGKGLDILLDAWEETASFAEAKDWALVLAGPDYKGYREQLETRIAGKGMESNTILTGLGSGDMKPSLFSLADVFVLPSHSEAFSMSILEAMAAAVPVLYIRECNFPELAACGAGWDFEDSKEQLAAHLSHVVGISRSTLKSMGEKGRELGMARYTLSRVGKELAEMYEQATGRDPACHLQDGRVN